VRTLLVQPVPADFDLIDYNLAGMTRSFGKAKLPCVVLEPKAKSNVRVIVVGEPIISAHYCFDADQPVLRFASLGGGRDSTVFNNLVVFQGQHLARDIKLTTGRESLAVAVETIESLNNVRDSDFSPPVGAVGPLGEGGTVSMRSAALTLLWQPPPTYPEGAKRNRVQGTVVMQAAVGKDGAVKSAQVVDGPGALRDAAVRSLRQWKFQPVVVLGEPMEVSTKIEIHFTLN
jgi:TonB family protein